MLKERGIKKINSDYKIYKLEMETASKYHAQDLLRNDGLVLNVLITDGKVSEQDENLTVNGLYYHIIEELSSRVFLKLCCVDDVPFQEQFNQDEIDVVEFNYNWRYEEIVQRVHKVMMQRRDFDVDINRIQLFNSEYNRVTYS